MVRKKNKKIKPTFHTLPLFSGSASLLSSQVFYIFSPQAAQGVWRMGGYDQLITVCLCHSFLLILMPCSSSFRNSSSI